MYARHNSVSIHLLYNGTFESVLMTTKTSWRWHVCCAEICWKIDDMRQIHLVHIKMVLQT